MLLQVLLLLLVSKVPCGILEELVQVVMLLTLWGVLISHINWYQILDIR